MSAHRRPSSPSGRFAAWRRRRHDRRLAPQSERLYAGHRNDRTQVHVVTRERVTPLAHTSTGVPFDWGTDDAGAVELARALLRDAVGRPVPAALAAALTAGPIARLPHDGFVLTADELHRWLVLGDDDAHSAWTQPWLVPPVVWPIVRPPGHRR